MMLLKSSTGTKIIAFEFALATIVAWVAVSAVPSNWSPPLKYVGIDFYFLFQFSVTIVAYYFFSTIYPRASDTVARSLIDIFPLIRKFPQWLLAISFFVLAAVFFLTDLSRSRYGDVVGAENVGDTTLSILLVFYKCYYSALVFAGIISRIDILTRKQWLVVCISMLLCIDGMAHIILLVIFLIYFAFPSAMYFNPRAIGRRALTYIAVVIFIFAAYALGVGWKADDFSQSLAVLQGSDAFLQNLYWIIYRLSSVFLSAAVASQISYHDSHFFVVNWQMISDEFMYRVCKLATSGMCSDYEHPLKSIARFNFSQLLFDDPGRGGASPGVFGSALYAFPWSVAGIACGFYYALISSAINVIDNFKRPALSFLCLVSSIYLLRILFLNTAAFFNPISGPFLGLIGVGLAFRQYRRFGE